MWTQEEILGMANKRVFVNSHSSIRVNLGDGRGMYFDPFNMKDEEGNSLPAEDDAAVIFFTHSHYDHFSVEDFIGLVNEETWFVMPKSMVDEARAACPGIHSCRLLGLEPGEKATLDLGEFAEPLEIEAIPAYNIGKEFHPRSNNWLGYVVSYFGLRYFVAGDTDVTPELLAVECDVAMLPVGGTYTMSYAEAAALVDAMPVKPSAVVPTHYGSIVGRPQDGEAFAGLVQSDVEVLLFDIADDDKTDGDRS